MATKVKTDKTDKTEVKDWTTFNGLSLRTIAPTATVPSVQTIARMLDSMGASPEDVQKHILAAFGDMVASKGKDYVLAALSNADNAASVARAAQRKANNIAILDTYNADNADNINTVAAELAAASLAMQAAKDKLAKLQQDAASKLDVSWPLEFTIVERDGQARLYCSEDVLGAKPKAKKQGRGGPRQKRIYDYSSGPWTKDVSTDLYGDVSWHLSHDAVNDAFDVVLTYIDGGTGETIKRKASHANPSTAAKIALWDCVQSYGNPKGYTDSKKIPYNLPSVLDIPYTKPNVH